jgi:hypothetical protein
MEGVSGEAGRGGEVARAADGLAANASSVGTLGCETALRAERGQQETLTATLIRPLCRENRAC